MKKKKKSTIKKKISKKNIRKKSKGNLLKFISYLKELAAI